MIKSTLRLFRAIQVTDKTSRYAAKMPLDRMVKHGYLLDPAIYPNPETLATIEELIGLSGEQANAAFHKSWKVVRDTPIETLVIQQIVHYMTTYGFENLGIYNQSTVYVPAEALDVPDVSLGKIPLVVIRALTSEEIYEKIVELGSGVALMQQTLDDIMEVVVDNGYGSDIISRVKNRELRVRLYDLYGIVPSDSEEYVRYVVQKLTGETLIIKNPGLIEKIKQSDHVMLDRFLLEAPKDLGSVFFRYKPLFLAMKHVSSNKTFFNRLRKAADKLHKPLPEDYLNAVTAKIKQRDLDPDELASRLEKATIFRKVRLAIALQYRMEYTDAIVYRVRNGRGWATNFDWPKNRKVGTRQALDIVMGSIVEDVRPNVEGKTIYIPAAMNYTLPATEKQFTGNFPTGTSVKVSGDTIVGIHWTNTKSNRIDLDLSVIGATGKLGWDAGYRSGDRRVLFSGDMTDAPAPHGATELFYFNGPIDDPKIIMVNYFNYNADDPVDCDLIAAHEKVTEFQRNHMVDPNNILARSKTNISKKQNVIGLAATVGKENRIYFANMSIGASITSGMNDQSMRARAYLVNSLVNSLDLRNVLVSAGALVVDQKPEEGDFLDLSPEALDKTTILGLLQKKSS